MGDLALKAAGLTHVGGRDHNEDQLLVEVSTGLVAVADGMGGHSAGEVASQLAIEVIGHQLGGAQAGSEEEARATLEEAFRQVNDRIHQEGQDRGNSMGTTLTVILVKGDRLYLGHIGDSRAYLVRNGSIDQLSLDHSVVAEALRSGRISPEEAKFVAKNALTRALGTRPAVEMDFLSKTVQDGDLVLICSDGLSNMVKDHELKRELLTHEVEPACQQLIDLANKRRGSDNVTAVVLQVGGRPPAPTSAGFPLKALLAGALALLVAALGYYFTVA